MPIPVLWRPGLGQDRPHYRDLTEDERRRMQGLNDTLRAIERRFHPIAVQFCLDLDIRVAASEDWLDDYELELRIDLYLHDRDPDWSEDDGHDNRLATLIEDLKYTEAVPTFGFGALDTHHAEPGRTEYDGQHHGWLFHHLYDHAGLGWGDLLRIGAVGAELVVTRQDSVRELAPAP
jgi:hypothetical protein